MKLVLLGTGGYYANEFRHTACLMVPEAGVVLDAGTALFRVCDYLTTDHLDIFLTHAHLDHSIGLTYLMDLLPAKVLAVTTVHGQADKLTAVRDHLFAEELFPVAPPFRSAPLDGPCPLSLGGTLQYFPLQHPGGSIGFRLDWKDCSLAYITDTTAAANAEYVDRIRGVNLLVHEAYFSDGAGDMPELTGHSRLSDVVRVAANAQVGQLILVHINPHCALDNDFNLDKARRVFSNVQIGTDRMELEF